MLRAFFIGIWLPLSLILGGNCCCVNVSCAKSAMKHQQEPQQLELSLAQLDSRNNNEITLQLIVTNVGTCPLVLPHLKEGLLEKYGLLWGWYLLLEDKDEKPYFYTFRKRPPRLTKQELIALKPKESFMTLIHVNPDSSWADIRRENLSTPLPEGEYRARVFIHLYRNFPFSPEIKKSIWTGKIYSNTIKIIIDRAKQE